MSAESNIEVARRVPEEAFTLGNLDLLDEVCSPDYVSHDPAEQEDIRGIEAHKERIRGYRTAMSDLVVSVDEAVASGDLVATRWRAKGTNDGELMGMPPTGKPVEITGMSFDRFDSDGKLVETWDQWDNAGFMMQLGISPEAVAQAS
ncbi:MAG TPA: ester cyclase [Thermoleophilaceae bacterium]|jgi:steroid delta-isomerase-like uncharacterized protein